MNIVVINGVLKSDQSSMSHFSFLSTNALPHPRLYLILLRKNTSFNQDWQCKSWLELIFLRSQIRGRRGWGKALISSQK